MKVRIVVESTFLDAATKLPPDRRKRAIKLLEKFALEPALPSLKFRPLEGAPGYFIINSAHGDRVIIRRDGDGSYAAVDVGPHDNIYRRWNR